jgi:hypothetical protein
VAELREISSLLALQDSGQTTGGSIDLPSADRLISEFTISRLLWCKSRIGLDCTEWKQRWEPTEDLHAIDGFCLDSYIGES